MSELQRVEDLQEPPAVGVPYLVRCLDLPIGLIPIMGPMHHDLVIGGAALDDHFHYHPQFVTVEQARGLAQRSAQRTGDPRELLTVALMTDQMVLDTLFLHIVRDIGVPPREVVLPCLRPMPRYDPHISDPYAERLDDSLEGRRVQCGKCPHQLLPLASFPREADGSIVCRGHGARFGKDGCLVRRSPQEHARARQIEALVQRWRERGG